MHVLITGGAGYIGTALTKHLLGKGEQVTVVDDLSEGHLPEPHPNLRFLYSDYRIVSGLPQPPDVIVHLAALGNMPESFERPGRYYDTNASGVWRIYRLAKEYKVKKVILASTVMVYPDCSDHTYSEEEPLPPPISPYAGSKLAMEHLASCMADYLGIQTVVLRFGNVIGCYLDVVENYPRGHHVLMKFIKLALRNEPLPIYRAPSGGRACVRQWISLRDVVEAIDIVIQKNLKSRFEVFNITHPEALPVDYLALLVIKELASKSEMEYCEPRRGDVDVWRVSTTKAASVLGFTAKASLEDIVRDTVRHVSSGI